MNPKSNELTKQPNAFSLSAISSDVLQTNIFSHWNLNALWKFARTSKANAKLAIAEVKRRLKENPQAIQILASSNSTFLLIGKQLFSCGSNDCGQLGLGHKKDVHTFTRIRGLHTPQQFLALEHWIMNEQEVLAIVQKNGSETVMTTTTITTTPLLNTQAVQLNIGQTRAAFFSPSSVPTQLEDDKPQETPSVDSTKSLNG